MPFYPFLGEGSPTKIDYRKKGALILSTGGPYLLNVGSLRPYALRAFSVGAPPDIQI